MLHYVTTNEGKVREAREYLGDSEALRASDSDEFDSVSFDYPEIQADSLFPIAASGARAAFEYIGEPVIVDDTGLFIDALDGFPGPYSAFVEDTLGIERVSQLARNEEVKRAAFRCVIAYCDGEPFDPTPEPTDYDRRGQDLSADERGRAVTDDTVVARTHRVLAANQKFSISGDVTGKSPAVANGTSSLPADGTDAPPVKLFEGVVPGRIVVPRGSGGFGYDPIFEYNGTTFAEMSTEEKNAISHRGRALGAFSEWFTDRT